jgi:hypothetical protein
LTQSSAQVKTVSSGHHDVQQEEGRGLPFSIGKYLINSEIGANGEASALQVVLHQAGDIRIIFQYNNRLTHFV